MKISKKINNIISKFIGANNFKDTINESLIRGILENKELRDKNIEYMLIKDDGNLVKDNIDYIDFMVYEVYELRKLVSNILANYATYIDYDLLCVLMECEDLLASKLFEAKINNADFEIFDLYKEKTITAIVKLNEINKKIKY